MAVDGGLEVEVEVRQGLVSWQVGIRHPRLESATSGGLHLSGEQALEDLTGRKLLFARAFQLGAEILRGGPELQEIEVFAEPLKGGGLRQHQAGTQGASQTATLRAGAGRGANADLVEAVFGRGHDAHSATSYSANERISTSSPSWRCCSSTTIGVGGSRSSWLKLSRIRDGIGRSRARSSSQALPTNCWVVRCRRGSTSSRIQAWA